MSYPLHPDVKVMMDLAGGLESLARESIQSALKTCRYRHRLRRGATLRAGPATPLWNELVRQAAPHLRKRGDKAKLGRMLNLPRQRIHQLLVARTACADAERTLLLLVWLGAKLQGRDLG